LPTLLCAGCGFISPGGVVGALSALWMERNEYRDFACIPSNSFTVLGVLIPREQLPE
jgi:hypothetical protein